MRRVIVIPLYDHTPDEEIVDILEALKAIGIDDSYVTTIEEK
jgi:hypothetical protein